MKQDVGVGGQTPESSGVVGTSTEFVLRAALRDFVDEDFVHSIAGRIIAEVTDYGEQETGCLQASLVQFDMALDHGIDTGRLGDGISGDISEYWERLFDVETGC